MRSKHTYRRTIRDGTMQPERRQKGMVVHEKVKKSRDSEENRWK